MKLTERQLREKLGAKMIGLRGGAQAHIDPQAREKIEKLVTSLDFESTPLDDELRQLIASCGALIIISVIDEKIENMAYLLRAIYTLGVQNGREEASVAN